MLSNKPKQRIFTPFESTDMFALWWGQDRREGADLAEAKPSSNPSTKKGPLTLGGAIPEHG